MIAASEQYMTSLQYTFPIYDSTVQVVPNVPRDILLSQTLKLPRFPPVSDPVKSDKPLSKLFNGMPATHQESPLDDILQHSRNKIQAFMSQSQSNSSQISPNNIHTKPLPPRNAAKISKRETEQTKSNFASINESNSNKSTPITNKTIYFSPSGKGKASTPPASVVKDMRQKLRKKSSKNLKQKLLRMDQASLVTMSSKNIQPQTQFAIHNDEEEHEDSDYDHLACHADNIMRLAVDSTMLGSTFNSSFSSSFSNSFNNDNTGKDFFDKEAKKSILEGLNF